jgi:tetratricopeptide (TPR) repeat protein
LAQLPELKVSGRTSSLQFRGVQTDIGEIAERLGVAHVLEGSVRLVGDDLRVTATLIRAQDGFQVWSNTYNGRFGELLDFQRDVAERVAGALDIVLDDGLRERMLAGGTRSVEAFEAYQEGRRATVDGLARGSEWEGVAHFERALTFDPGYALAALGKSAALTNPLLRGYPPSPYSQANALEEIRESYAYVVANGATPTMRLVADINLESHSPTWYRMPGLLNRLRAEGDFDSVLLGGDGANWLPIVLVITNRLDIRGTLADRHVATDPLAVNSWLRKATNHRALGDYEAARAVLAEARQAVGRSPVYDLLEFTIAREEGKRDEVIAYLSTRSDPSSAMFLAAVRGEYETALRLADEGEKMIPVSASVAHGSLMDTYYEAGATERLRTLVRRIDDAPHGTAILMQLITSFGGLSFDLADTPNFSAKLEQAGLNPTTYLKPLPRLSTLR